MSEKDNNKVLNEKEQVLGKELSEMVNSSTTASSENENKTADEIANSFVEVSSLKQMTKNHYVEKIVEDATVNLEEENKENDLTEKEENKEESKEKTKKKKMPILAKIMIVLVCLVGILVATSYVLVRAGVNKFNYVDWSKDVVKEETFDTESPEDREREVDEEFKEGELKWKNIKGDSMYDENVINILMVGDDQRSDADGHGNSDSIMIFTINKTQKTLKLTSIMRDTYVPIKGYRNNKINAAYNIGGISLLKPTIEENFKITIDSAIVAHFDTFPKLIDKLGGITVTLNQGEANYINTEIEKDTGVASNVGTGVQHLNGEEALRFSRIRKVSSDIYGDNDFGRTCRQRTIITQLYDKYKKLKYSEMVDLLDVVAEMVDIDQNLKAEMVQLGTMSLSFGVDSIEQMRFPIDGAYNDARVLNNNGSSMLILNISPYLKQNVDALHEFIYGNTDYDE